ncbi:MAG: NUDIX hydrolase [Acidimicrobiales bacterium]
MEVEGAAFDYHEGPVLVETDGDRAVFIRPHEGTPSAPPSPPGDHRDPGERPEVATVLIVRERTGLDVEFVREFVTIIHDKTHTGTTCTHRYVVRAAKSSWQRDLEVRRGPAPWWNFLLSCSFVSPINERSTPPFDRVATSVR